MNVYLVGFETDGGTAWMAWTPGNETRDGYVESADSVVWAKNVRCLNIYLSNVLGMSVDDEVTTHRPHKLLNQVRSGVFDPEALLNLWNAFTDLQHRDSENGRPFWYDLPGAKSQYEELFARSHSGNMVGAIVETGLDRSVIEKVLSNGIELLEEKISHGCCVDS